MYEGRRNTQGSEGLGRPTPRQSEGCVEVVMRDSIYVGMLEIVVEIGISFSIIVKGVYPNSWENFVKILTWVLIS